tara:strand:+ start:73 stop:486 length:414 start_codon:yes stop_codon:yes gene_type:complete
MNTEYDYQLAKILSNDLENNEDNNTLLDEVIHESLITMENKLLTHDRIIQDKEYSESLKLDLNKNTNNDVKTKQPELKHEDIFDKNGNIHKGLVSSTIMQNIKGEVKEENVENKFEELSPNSLRTARLKKFLNNIND